MSNFTVYYSGFNSDSLLEDKIVNNNIERGDYFDRNDHSSFKKCPIWKHRQNRTFIITSPIDIYLSMGYNGISLEVDGEKKDNPLDFFSIDLEDIKQKHPTIQFGTPNYIFWTKEENIWFEYLDHPLTALNNNFITISGWFNFSHYPRVTSFAVQMIDKNKPIIIKKGDPISRVRFYSNNLQDGIILKRSYDKPEVVKKYSEFQSKRTFLLSKKLVKRILFNNFSECPFKFFHKNKH